MVTDEQTTTLEGEEKGKEEAKEKEGEEEGEEGDTAPQSHGKLEARHHPKPPTLKP